MSAAAMSATGGFQDSNSVGNGEQLFRFPPTINFNFSDPLENAGMVAGTQTPGIYGMGFARNEQSILGLDSGHGQPSLLDELNDITLQGGPNAGSFPFTQSSPMWNSRSAPYSFTETQLLPESNGFQINPTALPLPDQRGIKVIAAGSNSGSGEQPIFSHADIIARLEAAEAKVQNLECQLTGKNGKKGNIRLEPLIREELHKTCTDLVGCFEKVRLTDDPDELPYYDLPEPLPAGAPDRHGPDGISILFNPHWNENVTSPYNNRYIEAVLDVMTTTKKHLINPETHTRAVLKSAAQDYLRSLKRARGFRLDAMGRERLERRRQLARRWNRRRVKAYELRKAAIILRKIVGHAQSVGLDTLVDTDWVSSEHSDGATESIEVRPVEWHSQKLRDLFASLRTIRAAQPKGKTLVGVSDIANPPDNGKDFTDEERIKFLRITKANIELRKLRATNQRPRVVGRSDERMRRKVVAKQFIYRECVSEEWATTHLPPDTAESIQIPHPASFTIWEASLPKELVEAKVR